MINMISFFFHQSNNFIPLVLTSVSFSVFTLIQQEELMGWHASGVRRTRILKYAISLNQLQKHMFSKVGVSGVVVVLGTSPLVIPDAR